MGPKNAVMGLERFPVWLNRTSSDDSVQSFSVVSGPMPVVSTHIIIKTQMPLKSYIFICSRWDFDVLLSLLWTFFCLAFYVASEKIFFFPQLVAFFMISAAPVFAIWPLWRWAIQTKLQEWLKSKLPIRHNLDVKRFCKWQIGQSGFSASCSGLVKKHFKKRVWP